MKRFLMPSTALAAMKRTALTILCGAVLLLLTVQARAGEWKVGHIIVATPGGQIEVLDSAGNVIDSEISLGTGGGRVGGCAFDSSYRVRCVDYDNAKVVRFALQDPHGAQTPVSVSATPQAILYTGVNNDLILGFAGGLVKRFDYTGGTLLKTCSSLATDASSTFWADIYSDQKTIVYTSGAAKSGSGTLRSFDITKCGKANSVFTLKLAKGQAFYGVRALANNLGTFDGSGGYIIALGSDILRVDSSGSPLRCYVSGTVSKVCPTSFTGVDGASNDWRAFAVTPDGSSIWAVNLATGHLFEFNIATGVTGGGPFVTSAGTTDDVGGIAVEGASDAAQPTVQTTSLVFTNIPANTSSTQSAFFCDNPASCGVVAPNNVAITLNAADTTVSDTFLIRFTEVAQVVGTSDTGLTCALESQDGTNCVVWEIEDAVSPSGTGATEDLLFFGPHSPPTGTSPTLLENLNTDVLTFISVDEIKTGKGGGTGSVYTNNLLQLTGATAVFKSGGWLSPITDNARNSFTGGSVPTKFINYDSLGNAVSTGSFGCSVNSPNNCPELFIVQLTTDHLVYATPPQGNTGGSGTAPLIFREGGDGITWIVTVDATKMQAGCYIFTGKDPQGRFAPFSYSTTTTPLTTIIRIGSNNTIPTAASCASLATGLGLVVQ